MSSSRDGKFSSQKCKLEWKNSQLIITSRSGQHLAQPFRLSPVRLIVKPASGFGVPGHGTGLLHAHTDSRGVGILPRLGLAVACGGRPAHVLDVNVAVVIDVENGGREARGRRAVWQGRGGGSVAVGDTIGAEGGRREAEAEAEAGKEQRGGGAQGGEQAQRGGVRASQRRG